MAYNCQPSSCTRGINTGQVLVSRSTPLVFQFCQNHHGSGYLYCPFCTCLPVSLAFFYHEEKMHLFIFDFHGLMLIIPLVLLLCNKGCFFKDLFTHSRHGHSNELQIPSIILWDNRSYYIVCLILNKTTLVRTLYVAGGNPEAAAVSGISVFRVMVGAFVALVSYDLVHAECMRMVGSGSAAYGQG